MFQLQVTMMSNKGFKPVSTLVNVPSVAEFKANPKKYRDEGILRICSKRKWRWSDVKQYGYDSEIKMRVYNKEKIEQEKAERYEQIKKERGWA
jgi:hypothetical protein